MRSTLVLGFIGLPTMGFYLESAFRQGRYAEAGALLLIFYALIGSRRLWMRLSTLPVLLVASVLALPKTIGATDWLDQPRALPRPRHRPEPAPVRRAPRPGDLGPVLALAPADPDAADPARRRPDPGAGADRPGRHRRSARCSCSPWPRAASPGRSGSPSGASSSWSCARRRNTCSPTCCCSCSVPRCCRRSWR